MNGRTIAQRLFDASSAEYELEDKLDFEYEKLGWDEYDGSLEIYGVAPDCRLDGETLEFLKASGFFKVYVNHTDKWETHYSLTGEGIPVPWRVSYPHKRGDSGHIWVEEFPGSWPQDWLKTGYVEVRERASNLISTS